MHDDAIKAQIQQAVDHHARHLRPDPFLAQRITRRERTETNMKKRLPIGLVFLIVLLSMMATALAAVLLSPKEVVEQVAVPLAQQNDGGEARQESFTNEELAQLIKTLGENGITMEADSRALRALESGQDYWEEETIIEICQQAFGGPINVWSIEEKHWFEEIMIKIGFAEYNCYLVPSEGDMTTAEARAYAAKQFKQEYGVDLPEASNENWRIEEWFFQYRDEEGNLQPARWQFEYVNRITEEGEYIVEFTRDGDVVDISEAGFHGVPLS
ncbi:MAG: hypothetical protein IJ662_10080 [Clostridia bacterium]|nr:hypothetical protein [Clostridia bacterium]